MLRSLSEATDRLGAACDAFPWHDPDAYADWCAQTYYYVCHSTRLLAAAAARMPLDERGNALHTRFGEHIGEEHKHELLALHDLKNMQRGMLDRFTELSSTRSMYEVQYFKVEHRDPLALFGYILPLEILASKHGPRVYEKVRALYGSRCISFLKVHVEEDEDHVEKAIAALAGVTPEQERLIEQSVADTLYAYTTMLNQIAARSTSVATVKDRASGRQTATVAQA